MNTYAPHFFKAAEIIKRENYDSAKAALKRVGIKQPTDSEAWSLLNLIKNRYKVTKQARNDRVASRIGRPLSDWESVKLAQVRYAETKPSIVEKLKTIKCNDVRQTLRAAYRIPSAGHGDEYIHFTLDPTEVGVRQEYGKNRNLYKGAYKGWSAQTVDTYVTVPRDWRIRVKRRGFSICDGLMTLDASSTLDHMPDGITVIAATWIEQGRGYAMTAVSGYIATDGRYFYHAESIDQALRGIKRKSQIQTKISRWKNTPLEKLVTGNEDRIVTAADARKIGACDYGIRSWCHSVGIDPDQPTTLGEVYRGYLQEPRSEARATIIAVLKKRN